MKQGPIIVAGATGDLGVRIVRALRKRGAPVRAVVRHGSSPKQVAELRKTGASIAEVDFTSKTGLIQACLDGSCVVSALSGLHDVIVEGQSLLLDAAIAAGVPRFIPSDYAIDYTRLAPGSNRNLDLRREFQERLDQAPIAATSILCGMFTDLLAGQAPIVIVKLRRVVYWQSSRQPMDFTTRDDVAAFTAAAALDPSTPRFLRIAGDRQSAEGLRAIASSVTGKQFKLLRAGGLGRLATLTKIMRLIAPQREAVYPPWQGMQYLHNMFSGSALLVPLDNERYPEIRWTPVSQVLAEHLHGKSAEVGREESRDQNRESGKRTEVGREESREESQDGHEESREVGR